MEGNIQAVNAALRINVLRGIGVVFPFAMPWCIQEEKNKVAKVNLT